MTSYILKYHKPGSIIKILIFSLLAILISKTVFPEEKDDYRKIAETILAAENELRTEIYSSNGDIYASDSFIDLVMTKECDHAHSSRLNQRLNDEKSLIAKEDIGVKFEAGYRVRNDELEGDSQSGFAGLSWDLLDNGLLGNRSKSKRYAYESAIDGLEAETTGRMELYNCRTAFLSDYFEYLKFSLLEKRLKILTDYYDQVRQLYFSGKTGAETLLKIELDVSRVKMLLENYELQGGRTVFNNEYATYTPPGIFALNFTKILTIPDETPSASKIETFSEEILNEKYSILNDKTLKLYARTGISKEENEDASNNVTVGVYFSTPINRKTNNLYPLELKRTKYRLQKEKRKVSYELKRLKTAYTEKLAEAVRLFYEIRITAERLRKSVIELEKSIRTTGFYDEDQNLLVYRLMQNLYDSRFKYLLIQESLYRRILYMFSLTDTTWSRDCIVRSKTGSEFKRGRQGERGIYIWSKDFKTYDNTFLIRVFAAKRISSVIISAADNTDYKKLSEFILKAKSYNISTQLMISENSWVNPDKWHRLEEKLTSVLNHCSFIHLDIEPHVLDDYKSNRETYDAHFLSMLHRIHLRIKDRGKLFVSLPVKHSPEFIEKVNQYSDKIYIMAYGTRKIDTMTRRLKPFDTIPPEKIVLALRPDDFETELQLEQFIDQVTEKQKITAFAFHDLGQFFDLSGTLKYLNPPGGPKP